MSGYRCTTNRTAADGTPTPTVCVEDSAGGLRATIVPQRGAELASLQVRHRGGWVELLHRALDFSPTDEWQGRAPLLWPAVGRNFTPTQLSVPDGVLVRNEHISLGLSEITYHLQGS